MSETKWPASQVHAIGAPAPKSWDDYEQGCMMTYRGGHHEEPEVGCFRHGMGTIFNLLRHEFPPAPVCKAAPDMLAALEEIHRTLTSTSRVMSDVTRQEISPWLPMIEAAIEKAKTG